MHTKRVVGKQIFTYAFCDVCKCEEKIYGCITAPEVQMNKDTIKEECHLCITCYNTLRAEIVSKGGRFNEIVPEPSPCSRGFHSWTHPNDQGYTHCLMCHEQGFDAEQARLHAHDSEKT